MPAKMSASDQARAQQVRENLKRYREYWELSHRDAADGVGVHVDQWRKWERGPYGIPSHALKELADFFNVTMDSFYDENPELPSRQDCPHIFLRAREGAEEDPAVVAALEKVRKSVREAEAAIRRSKARTRKRK